MCTDLKAAGVVGVIVQAITGLDGISYTRQQLQVLWRNGLRIAGYCWCFPGATAASMQSRLAMFDGFPIEDLWLDVEQAGLTRADVDRDLALCDAYLDGRAIPKRTGLYTAHWFFAQQGWLSVDWWADRRLWEALYNGIRDLVTGFVPYAGWTAPTNHQFAGTSDIGNVHQIDLDVEQAA